MNLKYRRFIYLSFIVFFLIITPIILLYAAGYSFNFKKGQLVKTGILYVDSKPKNADIDINGQNKGKTPNRFTKLLPDIYNVKVSKDGYYPWQKDIEIKSNLSEFAEDIVLFKDTLPINIVSGKINVLSASPNHRYLAYSIIKDNDEELRFLNLKTSGDNLIKKFTNPKNNSFEIIGWSETQNQAIFKEKVQDFNNYTIVFADSLTARELTTLTRVNFSKLDWGLENDVFLFGLASDGLYQIDLEKSLTQKIISGKILDFTFNDNNIYYLTQENSTTFLNKKVLGVSPSQDPTAIEKIKLSAGSKFSLQKSSKGYITMLDKKNHDLFIISENSFSDQNIENNIILQEKANQIVWSADKNKIIFNNDFEVWTYDFSNQQKMLVTRFSEPIIQALWYPQDKYIIYLLTNKIQAIEATDVKQRNDTKLVEMPEVADASCDTLGKFLYFKGKAGNQQGIYQLQLQ
ncbi:MAG: PEGA domain-containing protein [Candidatus Buchananbacteria bacterium]